eukprot:6383725-Amphidinium_carterae.3
MSRLWSGAFDANTSGFLGFVAFGLLLAGAWQVALRDRGTLGLLNKDFKVASDHTSQPDLATCNVATWSVAWTVPGHLASFAVNVPVSMTMIAAQRLDLESTDYAVSSDRLHASTAS